jgi:hypothetical protein
MVQRILVNIYGTPQAQVVLVDRDNAYAGLAFKV